MIRTSTRIALEVVIGILAVIALLVGVAIWRLSSGPVQLDFLTARVERALSDPAGGYTVAIGSTDLTWGGWSRTVDLHARNVRVRDAAGAIVAALPDSVVRISLRALIQGTVAATAVEVFGARLSLVRRKDGTFQFGPWVEPSEAESAADAGAEADLSAIFPAVIQQLMSRPRADEPLSFLSKVRILGGRLLVDDRMQGLSWQAPYADIELRRDARGLAGQVELSVTLGAREAEIAGQFYYDSATRLSHVQLTFDGVLPKSVVSFAPGLAGLRGLTTPLSGSASGSVALDGAIRHVRFDIAGGAGALDMPGLERSWPVRALSLVGEADGPERRLVLERARIDLGTDAAPGPRIEASGTLTSTAPGFAGDLYMAAEVAVTDVSLGALARYWPAALGGNERAWVLENVTAGRVERAAARVRLHVPGGRLAEARLAALDGTLRYRDLTVHYLRPMPPVAGISGTAKFDAKQLIFEPKSGALEALRVEPSTITITGLDGDDQDMAIDLAVRGPVRDMLVVLDHDRLRLIRRLNIDPRAATGDVAARIGLRFPLENDLGLEQIEIGARANLRRTGVKKLLLGLDASDGDLALEVDKSGMALTGPVSLAGVPFELNWIEAFSDDAPEPTRIEIEAARIDATARAALGIDTAPYMDGPVSVHLTAVRDMGGQTTVKAAINLQESTLRVAPLFWEKPAGDTGAAYFTLVLEGGRPVGIRDLEISAGTLRAKGAGTFRDDGKALGTLRLDELGFNGTSLREVAIDFGDDKIVARAGGGNLDATPWLSGDEEAPAQASVPAEPPVQPRTPDEPAAPAYRPLHLVARGLNAVYFGADRYFRDVDLEVERGAFGWNRIAFSGRVPRALWHVREKVDPAKAKQDQEPPEKGAKTLMVDFGPDKNGGRALRVTAEDMGAALRALDALDTVEGGRLEIVGHSDGPLPTATLRARIKARNYVLVGAPTLARLLTVASFTGIRDLLSGEGIRFRRLVGEVTVRGGKVHTDLLRAYGPALGLTAKGNVSVDGSETNIRGTVVPAYTVNRILGKIPLLGPLLIGGEGEGFIAITYKMSGPISDPKVTVNPLSALAPGFLRNLFNAGGDRADKDGTPSALPRRAEP